MKKLILSGLCLSALLADFTLEYKMGDDTSQLVQYKDEKHVKISTSSASNEDENVSQIIIGDKKYLIMKEQGETKYIDIDEMMKKMQEMSNQYGGFIEEESDELGKIDIKLVKKLENKIIAGINAEVWTVDFIDEENTQRMNIAVTNEKKVVDAIQKYVKVIDEFSQLNGEDSQMSSLFNLKDGYVLLSSDEMSLVNFNTLEIDKNLFTLEGDDKDETKETVTVSKPSLCPLTTSIEEAKQLSKILKPTSGDWNLLESGTCLNMMNMRLENAIYQKNNSYIRVSLAINIEDEKGIVATYRNNDLEIADYKKGKVQGKRYQSAYLKKAQQYAMDIRLENAMLTMDVIGKEDVNFEEFANNAFDLKQFTPIEKKKASDEDLLKDLGNMFKKLMEE